MRKRLLIVEDDFDIADLLKVYFNEVFDVSHAPTGYQAIELARTIMPHLILLDVMLPDIDGYDVCHTLRQVALTRYIPIIFLTQRDERANKVMGLSLGADDYVTKPFDMEELWLRVQGSINRASRDSLHEARSGLPTGVLVEEERVRRRMSDAPGLDLLLTIHGYESFRDVYGFMAADEVFAFAAHTLREVVQKYGTRDDFVGVEGDDFVLMTHAKDPAGLAERIRNAFHQGARAFYPDRDVQRGAMVMTKAASTELVPLMTMQVFAHA